MAAFADPGHTHDGPPTDLIVNLCLALLGIKEKEADDQKNAHGVAVTAQFSVFTHLLDIYT
jgi:hypothetical protein